MDELPQKGGLLLHFSHVSDVCFWHLADNPTAPALVRYWSNSRHSQEPPQRKSRTVMIEFLPIKFPVLSSKFPVLPK